MLLLVDYNRDILIIMKKFTLKSPVQQKQILRLNEDVNLRTYSLNNEVTFIIHSLVFSLRGWAGRNQSPVM